jgi:hypothetical protein
VWLIAVAQAQTSFMVRTDADACAAFPPGVTLICQPQGAPGYAAAAGLKAVAPAANPASAVVLLTSGRAVSAFMASLPAGLSPTPASERPCNQHLSG